MAGSGLTSDRPHPDDRRFWDSVGTTFPSLKGAASTDYYLECERMLHEQFFPGLDGRVILKTDLWDEAKNTEILRWAAERGARPVGVDVAFEIVREARGVLERFHPRLVVADIRALPFRPNSVDLAYSMGTIEHFPDYDVAVAEIYRVLKPRGVAIVGVPNKLDPFLRPLLVHILNRVGRYPYGMEKSFTPRSLRRLLTAAGFSVTALTGILFMPGWLRMVDLWCFTRFRPSATATGWLVRPFAWLYRNVPALRRHGYLIAGVVSKPGEAPPSHADTDGPKGVAGRRARAGGTLDA